MIICVVAIARIDFFQVGVLWFELELLVTRVRRNHERVIEVVVEKGWYFHHLRVSVNYDNLLVELILYWRHIVLNLEHEVAFAERNGRGLTYGTILIQSIVGQAYWFLVKVDHLWICLLWLGLRHRFKLSLWATDPKSICRSHNCERLLNAILLGKLVQKLSLKPIFVRAFCRSQTQHRKRFIFELFGIGRGDKTKLDVEFVVRYGIDSIWGIKSQIDTSKFDSDRLSWIFRKLHLCGGCLYTWWWVCKDKTVGAWCANEEFAELFSFCVRINFCVYWESVFELVFLCRLCKLNVNHFRER